LHTLERLRVSIDINIYYELKDCLLKMLATKKKFLIIC